MRCNEPAHCCEPLLPVNKPSAIVHHAVNPAEEDLDKDIGASSHLPKAAADISITVLPTDATGAARECMTTPGHPAANKEGAAGLLQAILRADAAASSFLADSLAAFKEAKAEADSALAALQQERANAQALVRMGLPLKHISVFLLPGGPAI